MNALFVETLGDGQFVNLARAVAIDVSPPKGGGPDTWAVMAIFSGRVRRLSTHPTSEEAWAEVRRLAARVNGDVVNA